MTRPAGEADPKLVADDRGVPLATWYKNNRKDIPTFEKQMRRKTHSVIQPAHLWNSIAGMARTQNAIFSIPFQAGFKYI